MGRRNIPKCKQCRRVGEKMFLKGEKCFTPKCPIVKRRYPPGVHGPKGYPRMTQFGIQLKEKQRVKGMYRLMEKQFYSYYKEASKKKGNAGEEMLKLLEIRLDNVVYLLGWASSRDQARQLVTHGHIKVNGRKVNIPSYQVKAGDKIQLKDKSQELLIVKNSIGKTDRETPDWMEFDKEAMTGHIIKMPDSEYLDKLGIDIRFIIEYYSK